MSQQNSLVGQTLGQYQIVELIGEGGMATVYKAWQPSLRRYVALKVLAPHLSNDAEFIKRFHQEAVSAANLKHPYIVTIHDVGVEGGHHYIAMEFIEGISLQERRRAGQAFTPEQVVDIVSQIGSALDYAHQRGFIHRDIKPANILIEASGRAVLTDFGIVKALIGSGVTSPLTQAGTIFGTPQYMSPEQVKDEPLDHRSDLYSLGIVCYEMLAGQVPFDGTTTHAILYAQVNAPPPSLRQFTDLNVPPPVEAVVTRMLAKERDSRYNNAGEFARDLAQAVIGVWPAGLGGETAVVGGMGGRTAVAGGTPAGMPAPTVRQPPGPPTPLPMYPTPPPMYPTPVPAQAPIPRRSRWPLVLGVVAAVLVLILVAAVGALALIKWYPLYSAQAALSAGDYSKAADGFGQILEREPGNAEATEGLLQAAANLAQAGQFEAAIVAFEKVQQVQPGEVRALQGLGQAHEAQGEWQPAAEWYEKWTQAAPDDPEARLRLGSAYYELGDSVRAAAEFERVTVLEPAWVEGWKRLGQSLYSLKQYERALEPLAHWKELTPDQLEARRLLGWCYLELGQIDGAIAEFKELVPLDPQSAGSYEGLGYAYYRSQDYTNAQSAFQEWAHLRPDLAQAHRMAGWAALRAGDNASAINAFNQALSIEEHAGSYLGLGQAYAAAGDNDRAIRAFEESLTLDPQQSEPYERMGWLYFEQDNAEEAVAAFEQAVKLEAADARAWAGLGYAYRGMDRHREALAAFQRWAELAPEDAQALNMVGWSYFALREFSSAIRAFEDATKLEERSEFFYGAGESYRRLGNCEQAMVFFNKALQLDPSHQQAAEGLEKCQP